MPGFTVPWNYSAVLSIPFSVCLIRYELGLLGVSLVRPIWTSPARYFPVFNDMSVLCAVLVCHRTSGIVTFVFSCRFYVFIASLGVHMVNYRCSLLVPLLG